MNNIDYQKEHEQFEKDMDLIRRAQRVLGSTYSDDLEKHLKVELEKRNIKYIEKKGKVTDQHIIIASGVGEIDETTFLINPPKKGIFARLANKRDETINDLWKQIYDKLQLSPLIGGDSYIKYVQAAEDGKYEKVVTIQMAEI